MTARTGSLVAFWMVVGATAGLAVGLFLAIPTAELVPGGRPVVLGSAALGALVGALVVSWRHGDGGGKTRERNGRSNVDVLVSRLVFKRPSGTARPSTTPVWQPASDSRAPRRDEEGPEETGMQQRDARDHAPITTGGDLNALLGKGSEFEGKLAFEGKVRIDGTFTGEISTNDLLMVGEGAKVQAEISCGTIVVEGDIVGNIKATAAVELRRPAKVHGDITTPSLVVEKGVVFEGRSRMDDVQSNIVPMRPTAEVES
jgi:cytoskeletal protein CcmA (bactofilin family)